MSTNATHFSTTNRAVNADITVERTESLVMEIVQALAKTATSALVHPEMDWKEMHVNLLCQGCKLWIAPEDLKVHYVQTAEKTPTETRVLTTKILVHLVGEDCKDHCGPITQEAR